MKRAYWVILIISSLMGLSFWFYFTIPKTFTHHLIILGLSKGHITPYVARFAPYKDKKMGGAAYVGAQIKKLVASFASEPYNIISLGSEISGTPEAYFTQGKAIIEAMNSFRFDGMLVGNIEFSFASAQLEELAKLANFPFISSNIVEASSGKTPPFVIPQKIVTFGNDFSVAILGITPANTQTLVTRGNVEGLNFLPVDESLVMRIRALREKKVSLIVLLTLFDPDRISPEEWEFIKVAHPDVFLMTDFKVDAPPPEIRDGILIKTVSGYNQGKEIDILDLKMSGSPASITSFTGSRIPIFCDQIEPDPAIAEKVNRAVSKIDVIKTQQVCEFSTDLERQYYQECPIGNFVTDSMREYFNSDMAVQNSGGIQSHIKSGVFTLGDLYNVLPFDNQVLALDLKGKDILDLLEVSASLKRGLLQVSGCSYVFANRSVNDFELKEVKINGVPLISSQTYRVTTNSFLTSGGDDFKAFKNGRNIEIGPLQREVVRSFLENKSASGPLTINIEGRIIKE